MSEQLAFNFMSVAIPKGTEIYYARVGGPPERWYEVRVFNKKTGEEYDEVVEVDAQAGFLVRYYDENTLERIESDDIVAIMPQTKFGGNDDYISV